MSLSRAIEEALQMRDGLHAQGMSATDLAHAFERAVRDVWPCKREWKYLCANCLDTGLELRLCGDGQACGLAHGKQHAAPHEYGVPCWCDLGRRFQKRERKTEDTDAAAARVSKPTRFGR